MNPHLIDFTSAELIIEIEARVRHARKFLPVSWWGAAMEAVCDAYELSEADLMRCDRPGQEPEARAVVYYLLREHTKRGFQQLADIFGQTHGTAIKGWKSTKEEIANCPEFSAWIAEIEVSYLNKGAETPAAALRRRVQELRGISATHSPKTQTGALQGQ